MNTISKAAGLIRKCSKWIALVTMGFMMVFISFGVIARAFGHPILGDVELVQVAMVILIMFGLGYTQSEDAHIAIGLVVDKFPPRVQAIFDVFAFSLTVIVCWIISWIYVGVGMKDMQTFVKTTDLLAIPHYPLNFIIAIGFFLWGMEALYKVIRSLINLKEGEFIEPESEV